LGRIEYSGRSLIAELECGRRPERKHVATGDSSLWKHRAFNLFWFGQTLSTTGDAFTAVAFPLLIY